MSKRKKNLRAFMHQNPDATIEEAWDSAWEGAQKHYHAKSMQALQDEIKELNAELKGIRADHLELLKEHRELSARPKSRPRCVKCNGSGQISIGRYGDGNYIDCTACGGKGY